MHRKSYSHFFSKKFQHICISLDVNFNESLTNDVVSFEQLGPALHSYIPQCPVILLVDSEGPNQTAWMCRLIWTSAVCIHPKTLFLMTQPILTTEQWASRVNRASLIRHCGWENNFTSGAPYKYIDTLHTHPSHITQTL